MKTMMMMGMVLAVALTGCVTRDAGKTDSWRNRGLNIADSGLALAERYGPDEAASVAAFLRSATGLKGKANPFADYTSDQLFFVDGVRIDPAGLYMDHVMRRRHRASEIPWGTSGKVVEPDPNPVIPDGFLPDDLMPMTRNPETLNALIEAFDAVAGRKPTGMPAK